MKRMLMGYGIVLLGVVGCCSYGYDISVDRQSYLLDAATRLDTLVKGDMKKQQQLLSGIIENMIKGGEDSFDYWNDIVKNIHWDIGDVPEEQKEYLSKELSPIELAFEYDYLKHDCYSIVDGGYTCLKRIGWNETGGGSYWQHPSFSGVITSNDAYRRDLFLLHMYPSRYYLKKQCTIKIFYPGPELSSFDFICKYVLYSSKDQFDFSAIKQLGLVSIPGYLMHNLVESDVAVEGTRHGIYDSVGFQSLYLPYPNIDLLMGQYILNQKGIDTIARKLSDVRNEKWSLVKSSDFIPVGFNEGYEEIFSKPLCSGLFSVQSYHNDGTLISFVYLYNTKDTIDYKIKLVVSWHRWYGESEKKYAYVCPAVDGHLVDINLPVSELEKNGCVRIGDYIPDTIDNSDAVFDDMFSTYITDRSNGKIKNVYLTEKLEEFKKQLPGCK